MCQNSVAFIYVSLVIKHLSVSYVLVCYTGIHLIKTLDLA